MVCLYSAYGLTLRTPFVCEGFAEANSAAGADIEVVEGVVPRALANPVLSETTYDVVPKVFLFRGGNRSARFLVEDGARITFERNPACEDALFQHHFLHHVMAAVLDQRQLLVLHGSSATNSATTVALTGESEAGKSTAMATLLAQGWRMLSDDIVALRLNDRGRLEIQPGTALVHLHADAAAALAVDTGHLPRPEWHRGKVTLPVNDARSSTPAVLNRLVHLEKTTGSDLRAEIVNGRAKMQVLLRSVYVPPLPEDLAGRFDLFAAALNDVDVVSVARPQGIWTLNRIVEVLTRG